MYACMHVRMPNSKL